MARTMQWPGTSTSNRNNHDRLNSSGGEKKDLWSNLLDNVASGRKVPKKNLIVLGGTQESQKEFIDSLSQDTSSRSRPPNRSKNRKIPIANQFALGYTYQNIYDSDHEDLLARLSLYTLSEPSPAYAPLLARLFTPESIPNTAIAILLDWAEPWSFARTIRSWMRLLRTVVESLPDSTETAMEDNNTRWQQARDNETSTSLADSQTNLPLGPGELDEPLGLPIAVVCQNALAVERLEKEHGYRESHFDFVLQFLRTTLLKHGAGLIYTMPLQPGQLRLLFNSMLDISSGLSEGRMISQGKPEKVLKHNVVDRERIIVPPGWDSWGKIRVLREGFDVEGISRAWSAEIQPPSPISSEQEATNGDADAGAEEHVIQSIEPASPIEPSDPTESDSIITLYEAQILDPHPPNTTTPGIDVPHTLDQDFLATQRSRLEGMRSEDENTRKQLNREGSAPTRRTANMTASSGDDPNGARGMVHEQIGPVQFNMGGIQYDAEDALRKLKERANKPQGTPERTRTRESTPFSPASPRSGGGSDIPVENLEAYFASLMKGGRAGSQSVTNSPRPSRDVSGAG